MIQKFAEIHRISVHVLFGAVKVLSFYGDHAFFVSDPHPMSTIAKMKLTKPKLRPDVTLMVVPKSANTPASEWLPMVRKRIL